MIVLNTVEISKVWQMFLAPGGPECGLRSSGRPQGAQMKKKTTICTPFLKKSWIEVATFSEIGFYYHIHFANYINKQDCLQNLAACTQQICWNSSQHNQRLFYGTKHAALMEPCLTFADGSTAERLMEKSLSLFIRFSKEKEDMYAPKVMAGRRCKTKQQQQAL